MLDFIKFHVRHQNNAIQGNFISGIFFTVTKLLEVILIKIGVDVIGLTDELKADREINNNLKEIEIEMTAGRLNFGPKTDVLWKTSQTILSKYTHNKLISKMKDMNKQRTTTKIMDSLQCKPINHELKVKFDDI